MADLNTQLRDYLNAVRTPVALEEIVAHPVTRAQLLVRSRRGPLVALAAAAVVLVIGLAAVLVQSDDTQAVGSPVVHEVVAGRQESSLYAVGFNTEGELCAEAGASFASRTERYAVCGVDDDQIAAMAYQGDAAVALAGWAPKSAADITVIYNGEIRRSLQLSPIPGYDLYAYGAIEGIEARFIEVQITDDTGQVIQRYFPSIGPPTDLKSP